MRIRRTIIAALALLLLLSSCMTMDSGSSATIGEDARELSPADLVTGVAAAQQITASTGEITIRESVTEITSDGIARTNVDYTDAIEEGYDYGDIIAVNAGSISFTAPVVSKPEEVAEGEYYIIFDTDGASIGKRGEDTGLKVGDRISFSMEEKAGYLREHILSSLTASEQPLIDLTHYEAGSMKRGHLFTVYAPLLASADPDTASRLLTEYSISSVVDLTGGSVDISNIEAPAELDYSSTTDMKEALSYIISFDKPYLIILGDNTVSYRIVPILEALMGGRLDQIISDCLQPYEEYYGLSRDGQAYTELADMITEFFTELNGGTTPRDKSLLTLAVTYLRNDVGLTVDEVSSLRLSLR